MAFHSEAIQKFNARDASDWFQVGDHQAYVGYIADEEEGSRIGIAYIRFRKGVRFDFLWAYDEVAVVTRGSLSVRLGDDIIAAGAGELIYMPAGVPGAFEIHEDVEACCVHHPTDGRAGREWNGPERRPPESAIRPVAIGDVWD